jgi:hypothetical protein
MFITVGPMKKLRAGRGEREERGDPRVIFQNLEVARLSFPIKLA